MLHHILERRVSAIGHGSFIQEATASNRIELNEDTLITIFYEAVLIEVTTMGRLRQLLCLTHVCRAWRAIALDLAELWGDVVLSYHSSDVFDILLARARDAPLATPVASLRPLSAEKRAFILSNIARFCVLDVPVSLDWAPVLAGAYLPHLVSADISLDKSWTSGDACRAPSLQRLTVKGCKIYLVAPQLQYLSLKHILDLDAGWLQNLLAPMANLQRLSILGSLPSADLIDEGITSIELPSITYFELASNAARMAAFMDHTKLDNPNVQMKLSISNKDFSAIDCRRLSHTLSPYLRSSTCNAIELSPWVPGRFMDIFSISPNAQGTTAYESMSSTLRINIDRNAEAQPFFATLLESLPETKIRSLYLSAHVSIWDFPAFSRTCMSILGAPQLANLDRLVYFLGVSDVGWTEIGGLLLEKPTVYPQLRSLELNFPVRVEDLEPLRRFAESLRGWLEIRNAAGLPRLEVRLCGLVRTSRQDDTRATRIPHDVSVWQTIQAMSQLVDERKLVELHRLN